jgi:hypothetical protein
MPNEKSWRGEVVDRRRWIRTVGCAKPDYLLGNSFTFPGRMYAFCPHEAQGFSVSLSEIAEMSSEAASWIDGFLAGNGPDGQEMFGAEFHDFADDDPRVERWREAIRAFRRSGEWPTDRAD